ncbi:MAG: hypothetical protein FWE38_00970 [Firmicutes bacterium]|nr:hypothetical protein [Bacillota bacterium]
MDECKVIDFPVANVDEGLSDTDLVNLVMGMVSLLRRYADDTRMARLFTLMSEQLLKRQ